LSMANKRRRERFRSPPHDFQTQIYEKRPKRPKKRALRAVEGSRGFRVKPPL
jgi:hypothetical protein